MNRGLASRERSPTNIYIYIIHYQPSRHQAAMLVHKEFAAGNYSHHTYALTAVAKNWIKKKEQMDVIAIL